MLTDGFYLPKEQAVTIYNRQAIIDDVIDFTNTFNSECFTGNSEIPSGAIGFWRAYNERSGKLLKNLALSISGNIFTMNASVSDMTFEDEGYYFYEIGYESGGYEYVFRYGTLKVI